MSKVRKLALVVLLALLSLPVIWGMLFVGRLTLGFLDPTHGTRTLREYQEMENEDLLRKLKGFHFTVDETAVSVLRERKDPKLLKILLDFLEDNSAQKRAIALRSLDAYEDASIIAPLMDLVQKKRWEGLNDSEYRSALITLSKVKHEEVWPYVVELAKADKPISNGSPNMLKYFEKPEGIPLLKAMKAKIIRSSPTAEKVQLSIAEEAIQHLESVQKENK